MLVGYARVSKNDGTQVLDAQRDALAAAGVAPHHIYCEMQSGRKEERPELEHCLKALRPGDTLVVVKLDRLGRSMRHLMNLLHQLGRDEIHFKVLDGVAADLDTRTATGRLIFHFVAMMAEFEADLISERTKAGLAAARRRGRKGGRPFALQGTALDVAVHSTKTDKELGTLLHVHPYTVYRARRRARLKAQAEAAD